MPHPTHTHRRRRAWRGFWLMLAAPALFTGVCADLAQRSLINGFFQGVTPVAEEQLASQLASELSDGESATNGAG